MCVDPFTAIAIAGTVVSAVGSVQAGNAADAAGKYNAAVLKRQAKAELAASNLQSQDIRHAGERSGGEIRAIQGASGVDMGGGSAADVGAEDAMNYEWDALRALYGGQNKAWGLTTEAEMARYEGRVAKQQGYIKAAGTLLSNASRIGGSFGSPGGGVNANAASTGVQTTYRANAPINPAF